MTDKCHHGVRVNFCYTCFQESQKPNCKETCWCKTLPRSITMSDLYEVNQRLQNQIDNLNNIFNAQSAQIGEILMLMDKLTTILHKIKP